MRSAIALSVAALAGSALAAPAYGQYKEVKNVHVVVETVVHTVYITEGYEASTPHTSTKTAVASQAPAETTTVAYVASTPVYEASTSVYVAPTTTAVYTPAPTSETPSTTSTAASSTSTGDVDYMSIVSEWRSKMGLTELASDSTLESNAMNCVVSSDGEMVHKLNPGTYGQVLAQGKDTLTSFTSVFVGGWLCEIPTLPGLDGICTTMSEGWSYDGQTGHAQILTSPNYSKIGCANYAGIWACDLA